MSESVSGFQRMSECQMESKDVTGCQRVSERFREGQSVLESVIDCQRVSESVRRCES